MRRKRKILHPKEKMCTPSFWLISFLLGAKFFFSVAIFFLSKWSKSKRIIFLNPEPKTLWGTGDSEMNRYAPYCHKAKACSSLSDLEKVVEDLLRYSF